MNNKKIYSIVLFLIMTFVVLNSFVLVGAGSKMSDKSIVSILKNNIFENSVATSSNDSSDYDNSSNNPQIDEGFTLDESKRIDNGRKSDGVGFDDKDVDMSDGEENDELANIEKTFYPQLASGAVVMEMTSKRVLCDENMNVKCYPASTTKVLTAFVVLNTLPLDRVVTVPKQAEGVEGSSIYLHAGEKITVNDLLLGLMLRSGNDAATALAIEAAGSVDKFALLMNKTAKSVGAVNSHFVNPHGLHDDDHYTTAYDLALITAAAYENEDFVRIVSTQKAKILVDDEPRYIANKNKLLTLYEGANGVKTGYTKKSGRCLVGGACKNGMQLISVVLNYGDMWNDTIRLLNYGFDNFEMVPLDNALLRGDSAKTSIEINCPSGVTEDWKNVCYPLRKDGSEYLVLKAA